MTVHFIGAGPGAADLITLRGRDLIARCPVCLYAGSIVPKELLAYCPQGARIVDTAPLSLDEIEAEFVAAHAAGKDVARLHSGDLSIYSALAEQLRRLERRGIPYTLTPGRAGLRRRRRRARLRADRARGGAERGADAGARAAPRACRKARRSRRSPRPARRSPSISPSMRSTRSWPSSRRSMAATVRSRSWPSQLARASASCAARSPTSTRKLAAEPIERTALILVGRALAAEDFRDSALYDADYRRRFRGGAA